jgi:hypothetical protein
VDGEAGGRAGVEGVECWVEIADKSVVLVSAS